MVYIEFFNTNHLFHPSSLENLNKKQIRECDITQLAHFKHMQLFTASFFDTRTSQKHMSHKHAVSLPACPAPNGTSPGHPGPRSSPYLVFGVHQHSPTILEPPCTSAPRSRLLSPRPQAGAGYRALDASSSLRKLSVVVGCGCLQLKVLV